MTESTAVRRPWWQIDVCPDWCTGKHFASTSVGDRVHGRIVGSVVLTMADDVHLAPGIEPEEEDLPSADVFVEQGYREIAPHILLDANRHTCELTVEEATALAEQLTRAVDLAMGHWGGRS